MAKDQRPHPRNTFPLEPGEVLTRQLQVVGAAPATWYGVGAGLLAMVLLPWWLGLPCAGIAFGATALFWKRRWPRLSAWARDAQIAQSNEAQDESLQRGIRQLRKWDYDEYATILTELLALKQTIEQRIHRQTIRVPADEEVEKQIDTLCAEVRADLFKMADIRYTLRKRRKHLDRNKTQELHDSLDELMARATRALEVVHETKTELESVIGPIDADLGANPVLDDAIARLREQTVLARRVRDRIHSTMGPDLDHRSETTYGGGQTLTE